MKKLLSVVLFALSVSALPAFAQPAKIFLSALGDDANDGSRSTPKRSLQAGHDSVMAGGELVILDTAGYGPFTINKSVSVVVPPGVNGFITVADPNGNGVLINAGQSDVVTLRGLIVEGQGQNGGRGLYVGTIGTLVVEDTTVRNFQEGIYVRNIYNTQLVVRRGAVRNSHYGIDVEAAANNISIYALVTGTEMTGNTFAFYTTTLSSSGAVAHVVARRCSVAANNGRAFFAYGSGAENVADGCTINGGAAVYETTNGGTNYSRGNNTLLGTAGVGTTPVMLSAQ